jgi:hypothetical protein
MQFSISEACLGGDHHLSARFAIQTTKMAANRKALIVTPMYASKRPVSVAASTHTSAQPRSRLYLRSTAST